MTSTRPASVSLVPASGQKAVGEVLARGRVQGEPLWRCGGGRPLAGDELISLAQAGNGRFGYLDGEGRWRVPPTLEDARTYSWDGRTLTQVTVDHSAVQELIDLGELSRADAEHHPHRNVVTRALGADTVVDPDIWILPARARQTFLLCSDGLTKELSDDEIARIIVFHDAEQLRESDNLPLTLAERLVRAAVAAGGSDNITVVLIECELTGVAGGDIGDDTHERGNLPGVLEDTRPRG